MIHVTTQTSLDRYDVVEITPSNAVSLGYDPEDTGLKVQYAGEWQCDVNTLADAAEFIGEPVQLVEDPDHSYGTRWDVIAK